MAASSLGLNPEAFFDSVLLWLQNGFQIIYSLWILYEYGMDSKKFVVAHLCLGMVVPFLCSYVTLPLYAFVSQMGPTMKQPIFDDQTSKAPAANSKHGGGSPSGSPRAGTMSSGEAEDAGGGESTTWSTNSS